MKIMENQIQVLLGGVMLDLDDLRTVLRHNLKKINN